MKKKMQIDRKPGESDCDWVDSLPPDIRAVVHDYGQTRVRFCLQAGITDGKTIRNLLASLLLGSPDGTNRTHKIGANRIETAIDSILLGLGAPAVARELVTTLRRNGGLTIIPLEPTPIGIDASLGALDRIGYVTREQKHKIRLRAAVRATDRHLWEGVEDGVAFAPEVV